MRLTKITQQTARILIWLAGGLMILAILLSLFVQLNSVQQFLVQKAARILELKTGTPVQVKAIKLKFPKSIAIEGIYLEDQKSDTLWSSELISVDIALLKLMKNKLAINNIKLKGVTANIYRQPPHGQFNFDYILKAFASSSPASTNKSASEPFDVAIKKIHLQHVKLKYTDEVEGINTHLNFRKFKLNFNKIDLERQELNIDKVELENTFAKIEFLQATDYNAISQNVQKDETAEVSGSDNSSSWKINIDKIVFSNTELVYNNFNSPQQAQGIDFSHIRLNNTNISAINLSYGNDAISGQINKLSFNSADGFVLKNLKTKFKYSPTHAKLEDFSLETPHSQMHNQIEAKFPSIAAIIATPEKLILNIELIKNQISFGDILTFVPELSTISPFRQHPEANISFTGSVTGPISQLSLQQISISTLNDTRLLFSGNISGLPNIEKSKANINIQSFASTQTDISKVLTNNMLPDIVQLPNHFSFNGTIIGSMNHAITKLKMKSTSGNAVINAEILDYDKPEKATYLVNFKLDQLNAGQLLSMEQSLSKLSGNVQVIGQGFDPKTMQAQIKASIENLYLMGYQYQNIVLDGKMDKNQLWANMHIKDPNISIEMDAHADLINTFPAVDFNLKIETLNLQALNIYDADMILSGLFTANLPSTNPDSLVGTAETSDFLLVSKGKDIPIGKLKLVANAGQNEQHISLNSYFVKASLNGNYQLTKLPSELLLSLNKHLNTIETPDSIISNPQQFDFKAKINSHPIINEFVPQLSYFEPVFLSGNFNSHNDKATLQVDINNLIFNNINLNKIQLNLQNNIDSLSYQLELEQISFEGFEINHISAYGAAQNKQANVWLNIKDMDETDKYHFGAKALFTNSSILVSLNPNHLLLNYQPWNAQTNNNIKIDSTGFNIKNLRLWSQNQELRIEGTGISSGSHMQIDLKDFKISTLAAIAETDTLIANGVITGQAQVRQLDKTPVFEGDLHITDFSFYNDTIGNIHLMANNNEANRYSAQALISGKGNELILDGYYLEKPEDGNQFSFDADIRNFSLATAEPFTMGYLRNLTGNVNGKMKITGTIDQPKIRGKLGFNQASFNVGMLNATFSIDNESIEFVPNGIIFNNFSLNDENRNNLAINGQLFTTTYRDYRFGLDINSRNFRVLNSTRADNDLFYGQVYLNTALRIRGDLDNPQVEGLIRINPLTNFTFIVPQISPDLIDREGVVKFVDMSNPDTTDNGAVYDSLNISRIKGLDVAMSIEIDTMAIFTVIIDENSGDRLEIQGDARLTAGIDPGGNVNLTGIYEVTRGAYELSFNMIRRRFKIDRGSQITWQGQPMDAITNITAIYPTNTSAYNLVENRLNEPTLSLNRYKQRLPFEVLLQMQGELLKPQLSFDIRLPDGNYNVAGDVVGTIKNQLVQLRNNESELNKQVFSLLLLNSFVADNPFTASNTSSIESTARSSASRLLSDQMNQLAGSLIQGVDFNFDLISDEDYTTGSQQYRTDLNIDVSKNLFNDRLKVSVGSNFELEGPQNSNREATNLAGNVALDYRLSRDGRYLLRAYRKNEYQGVAEGYIIETGVGFIFTFDYSKFSEMMKRKEEEMP
jgi:hypothetical protein